MKKRKLLGLAGAVAVAFAASSAHATLQEASPFKVDINGTGLGNVQTILTITSPANTTTELGSVFANGTGEMTSGNTITSHNNLGTFSGSASDLRIVFNPSEPQNDNDGITLQSLVLTAFDADGNQHFMSGMFSPVALTSTDAGTGQSGFVFKLDPTQTSMLDAAISLGATRIGLSAMALDATGGNETFFLAAVPEPGTWAMLAVGLIGVAGMVRRRVPF